MGQYFQAYLKRNDEEKVFNPHSVLFRTRYKIEDGLPITYEQMQNEKYFQISSGIKLMEHSWFDDLFVNGVLEAIEDNPAIIAWIGDYADYESDFSSVPNYSQIVYKTCWNENSKDCRFDKWPKVHNSGYLINHTTLEYIDLKSYFNLALFNDYGFNARIHPLPILTAIGNGRGCGDYYNSRDPWPNQDKAGAWAMNELSYSKTLPESTYKDITKDYIFKESHKELEMQPMLNFE